MASREVGAVVGTVGALYRFPVKSMGGESLDSALLYWHGVEGDRRQVFVKTGDLSTFPWLTARDVPDLVRYTAYLADPANWRKSPVLVRPPDGGPEFPVESAALRETLERLHGAPLHLMRTSRGAHDAAGVSVVGLGSLRALGERLGQALDIRRFRENIYLETLDGQPYVEEEWVGRSLTFGDGERPARVRLLRPDHRCMIVNLDPDRPGQDPAILREIVESRDNCVGLYGSVEATGTLQVGDPVYLT
jgi:MOSC domain-containing protein